MLSHFRSPSSLQQTVFLQWLDFIESLLSPVKPGFWALQSTVWLTIHIHSFIDVLRNAFDSSGSLLAPLGLRRYRYCDQSWWFSEETFFHHNEHLVVTRMLSWLKYCDSFYCYFPECSCFVLACRVPFEQVATGSLCTYLISSTFAFISFSASLSLPCPSSCVFYDFSGRTLSLGMGWILSFWDAAMTVLSV